MTGTKVCTCEEHWVLYASEETWESTPRNMGIYSRGHEHTVYTVSQLTGIYLFFQFIYFERESISGRGAKREGERESQASSVQIMTWTEVKSWKLN